MGRACASQLGPTLNQRSGSRRCIPPRCAASGDSNAQVWLAIVEDSAARSLHDEELQQLKWESYTLGYLPSDNTLISFLVQGGKPAYARIASNAAALAAAALLASSSMPAHAALPVRSFEPYLKESEVLMLRLAVSEELPGCIS